MKSLDSKIKEAMAWAGECDGDRTRAEKDLKLLLIETVKEIVGEDVELRARFDKNTPRWNKDLIENNLKAQIREKLSHL